MWHGCCFVDDVIETSCINGCAVHVRHATISCHTINLVKQDAPHNRNTGYQHIFNALSDSMLRFALFFVREGGGGLCTVLSTCIIF